MVMVVVVDGEDEEGTGKRWGTWEELILGGAVLRHGTHDWNVIASELQARSFYPFNFTPEVCKAKYEDLQHCYSGYSSWFEELKKRRVAELKKALEKSEDLIGSLESKLEALKAEKTCSNADCSHANFPVPFQKFEGDESFGKDTSKDGLSAGSFTKETQPYPSPHCHLKMKILEDKIGTKPSLLETSYRESFPGIVKLAEAIRLECGISIRKKRGERKRKGWDVKEACVGENNSTGSSKAETKDKEQLAGDVGPSGVEKSSCSDDQLLCLSQEGLENLMLVLNTVLEDERASIFQRRMDGQKRARYKKLIRQHMDLETIRSRIANKSITTLGELFRDLLLLANNALVFYSKTTREYKCALVLRKRARRKLWQHDEAAGNRVRNPEKSPVHKPPVNRRSAPPFNNQLSNSVANSVDDSTVSVESSVQTKGSPGQRGKGWRRGSVDVQAKTLGKTRKRPRIAS